MPARPFALLTAALLAAGCGRSGGELPGRLPPLSPARIVGSAAPGAPNASAGAVRAATSAVRAYYDALNGLRAHMQTSRLAPLLAGDCPCRVQLRAVRAAIRHHERYTDRVRIVSLVAHLDRADLVDVVVSLDVRNGGLVDRLGRRVGRAVTTRNLHRELLVRRLGARWLIGQVIAV